MKKLFSFLFLLFLLLSLIVSLRLAKTVQRYLSEALGKPAKIVVETKEVLGPMPKPWQGLCQGGEEKGRMLASVVGEVANLRPKYIRIDHLYDFYDLVRRENGGLKFDWSKLDQTVDDILATGAKPFFSLSYMPPVIAKDGQITNPPLDWNEWSLVVQRTIEHYSGRNQKNLNDVYYEVWNEPDLFGGWNLGCSLWRVGCDRQKNYGLLYQFAVLGAERAKNVNPFKIGGPATTGLYQAWVDGFLKYVAANKLRLDFYSWHRYSINPEDFRRDVDNLDSWFFKYSGYSLLPKLMTEWGSISENSSLHDGRFDAAHLIASLREILGRVDFAFVFEIKDGPDPEGKQYWGRWGLLTHEKFGVEKKPKYQALVLLNRMTGNWVRVDGEGSWVKGMASKKGSKIWLILTNYDSRGIHSEKIPVTFRNLEEGKYLWEETFLLGQKKSLTKTASRGSISEEIFLPANSLLLIELTRL